MPLGLSIRAYARRRGVSQAAVQKAIRSERISTLADGSIDPEMADRQWAANTDQAKPRNSVSGEPRRRRDPEGPSLPAGSIAPGSAPTTGGYVQARGVREGYVAALARLEYLERVGEHVKRAEVRSALFTVYRFLRDRLQAMPDQLDSRLAASADRAECHDILLGEIDRILDELSAQAARQAVLSAPGKRAPVEPAGEPAAAVASA